MPTYEWRCKTCDDDAVIQCKVEDMDQPPIDLPQCPCPTPDRGGRHTWERQIAKTTWHRKWSGSKGNW